MDPRSKTQQVRTLALKKKKKGPAPKCRACRKTQNEDESMLQGFMSLMKRVSLQKQCFIFARNNNA